MRNGAGLRVIDGVTINAYIALLETEGLMKDQRDNKTMDLLRSQGYDRQKAFKERQAAMGRRQRPLWLTDSEFEMVKQLLDRLRAVQP